MPILKRAVSQVSPAEIRAKLSSALSLLRQGQYPRARNLLTEVVSADPGSCDAHWLLAGALFETGDLDGALREVQTVIRLQPDRAAAHVMAGRILGMLGNTADAARLLRRALEIQRDPATAAMLARALLSQNLVEDARAVIQPFLGAAQVAPELLLLHGHASMLMKESDQASQSFGRLVALAPHNADAKIRFAAALSDAGKHIEAEAQVRAAIQQGQDTPESRFVLGRALLGQNRIAEAEPELKRVVRANPAHVAAQSNLCELVWMQTGDVAAASADLDAALRSNPNLSALRIGKARLLMAAGNPAAALEEIERGLYIKPDEFDLLLAAAQTALEHDSQAALKHATRALQLMPDNQRALCAYGDALLAVGSAGPAAAVATKLVELQPEDGRGIAMLASAWRMMGDPRSGELFDYEHFVSAQLIDTPAGWTSLDDYLGDLASALHRQHSLSVHPIGQSLRGGSQLELDFDSTAEPAIAAFPQAIHGPICRYLEALGSGVDLMRRRNTGHYRLKGAWSVRLRSKGFHVNHFHPEGWISSACYIELPSCVEGDERAGWLQLGEPGFRTAPPLPPEHFVKPRPGLLALFPSYMWHGTVPFSGTQQESRLTIAFDVLPGGKTP